MRSLLFLVALLCLFAACGGGGDEATETTHGDRTANGQAGDKPIEAIPTESQTEMEKLAGAKIVPYFDEAGTQSAKDVEPGENFNVYVFAEFNELTPMQGVEYRLIMPYETFVLGNAHTDSVIVTLGKWDNDIMMVFKCLPGPKSLLSTYFCKAGENFAGGIVETTKGNDRDFMGFTMCDATKTLIRAQGGKANLGKE